MTNPTFPPHTSAGDCRGYRSRRWSRLRNYRLEGSVGGVRSWAARLLVPLLLALSPAECPAGIPTAPWQDDPATRHSSPTAPAPTAGMASSLQQFTVGGHVIGFGADHFYLAGMDHALKVEFVRANPVQPESPIQAGEGRDAVPEFVEIRYAGLWPGIDLRYRKGKSGLAESFYELQPGADIAAIRLRYNRSIALRPDGSLEIGFDTGAMRETAPVAWQEIEGRRQPVEVAFVQRTEREIGFRLGSHDPRLPLWIDPELSWNTFLWSASGHGYDDYGQAITRDAAGDLFVTGYTAGGWGGIPTREFTGSYDAFVAKLSREDGTLIWHTFLGGNGSDTGYGIAVDGSGNPVVVGESTSTWGSPMAAAAGGTDAFAAKLSGSNGALSWNTFLGASNTDRGRGIAVDSSGDVLVTGYSYSTWGYPIQANSGSYDAFVAKLSGEDGNRVWNTFLGGTNSDYGNGIVVISDGDPLIVGYACNTWGAPKRAYAGGCDAFAARLSGNDGSLVWNTFLGSTGLDEGYGIAVDGSGNLLLTGRTQSTWGAPVRPFTGDFGNFDAFVAKLGGSDGTLIWNTFLGGAGLDSGAAIALDGNGNVLVTGYSRFKSWGAPIRAFSGSEDAFVARLSESDGTLAWNTFLGGTIEDYGNGIAADANGNLMVIGSSETSWGNPATAFGSGNDIFLAKISGQGSLAWNGFLGSDSFEGYSSEIIADGSGDLYVVGHSEGSWGAPARAYTGWMDAFVAKLSGSDGSRIWNTFLGGPEIDLGGGIALDGDGNLLVTGRSWGAWGTPVRAYSPSLEDAFVAKLSGEDGSLLWHTFLGGWNWDEGRSIVADGFGDLFVAGASNATWGAPNQSHYSGYDAFLAKIAGGNGNLIWNTFFGGNSDDKVLKIVLNGSQIAAAGYSAGRWGTPTRPYTAGNDGFVAGLSAQDGTLIWNTFLGGSNTDVAQDMVDDSDGHLFVTGYSMASWGSPVRGYSYQQDAYVAKLSWDDGTLVWNTFLGGNGDDVGIGLALTGSGNPLVIGNSATSTWGAPESTYSGGGDVFMALLQPGTGQLRWNTFVGGAGYDSGSGVAVLPGGSVAMGGDSYYPWGDAATENNLWAGIRIPFVAMVAFPVATPSAAPHGSVTPNTPQTVDPGDQFQFVVAADIGYTVGVGGTCGGVLNGSTYTTDPIYGDCTVEVDFNPISYSLAAQASPSAGGAASCGPNPASYGGTVTCTPQAATGYSFQGWSPTPCAASFAMPAQDLTCTATFVLDSYLVDTQAGAGGGISPTSVSVEHGSTTSLTVTPNSGYAILSVVGCGGALSGNTYTTGPITAACTVSASFSPSGECTIGAVEVARSFSGGVQRIASTTEITTVGTVAVENTATVLFEAGQSIRLEPEFTVQSGSEFIARVAPVTCNLMRGVR